MTTYPMCGPSEDCVGCGLCLEEIMIDNKTYISNGEEDSCPFCEINFKGKDIFQHFLDDYTNNGIPAYSKDMAETIKQLESSFRFKESGLPEYVYQYNFLELLAFNSASMYGWSKENPRHFKENICGIETEQYDGVTFWQCSSCNTSWKRFKWSDFKYLEE